MAKIILITGAASGFGKATSFKLLEQGHVVYAADLNIDTMDELKSAGAIPLKMDVTNLQEIKLGVEQIIQEQGRIDVLANNAGYALYDTIESCDLNRARAEFEVNFWGPAMLVQEVLPYMRKARSGRIVNTSSVAGKVSGALTAWYSASKYAIEAFSDALRMEAGLFGIKVAIVEPGTFKTGFGTVVTSHFDKIDAHSDYQPLIDAYIKGYVDRQKVAPSPEPVVEALFDAITSENPKIRYVVGEDATAVVEAQKVMSDEEFDALGKKFLNIEA